MTIASMTNQPCPQPMHTHSYPANDNHNTATDNEFVDYYVCPIEIDEACHWLAPCWPMAWLTIPKTLPTPPCHHHVTTDFRQLSDSIPSADANQYLDDDTCPQSDILLKLAQLNAQCKQLQILLDQMPCPTDHPKPNHPAVTPAFSPPSDAMSSDKKSLLAHTATQYDLLVTMFTQLQSHIDLLKMTQPKTPPVLSLPSGSHSTPLQHFTQHKTKWLHLPNTLDHNPIQLILLAKLPSGACQQIICIPPWPPNATQGLSQNPNPSMAPYPNNKIVP